MATQKPTSTISYNTRSFLLEKLNGWYQAHIIQAYQVIFHKGEDGDKDHAHVRIEPNKRIDVMDLTEALKEFVINEEKPRRCRPWRPSVEEDWILYVLHDPQYLKMKYGGGEKGEKIPYQVSDIFTSPDYDMEVAYIRAKASMAHTSASLVHRLQSGEKAFNLLAEGNNPMVVNSIIHALNATDYENLAVEFQRLKVNYDDLNERMANLIALIQQNGFVVDIDGDGNITLYKQEVIL